MGSPGLALMMIFFSETTTALLAESPGLIWRSPFSVCQSTDDLSPDTYFCISDDISASPFPGPNPSSYLARKINLSGTKFCIFSLTSAPTRSISVDARRSLLSSIKVLTWLTTTVSLKLRSRYSF
jgi:hypothetical protein